MLKGTNILLRKVGPDDLWTLLDWENDPDNWQVSGTSEPFTVEQIEQFILHQQSGATPDQQRWMICLHDNRRVGALDLFDINLEHAWAGVGILIADKEDRGKGYALEALQVLCDYLRQQGVIYNLYCNIQAGNSASIRLFEKAGFEQTGIRKDWYLHQGKRIDEYQYQLCLKRS